MKNVNKDGKPICPKCKIMIWYLHASYVLYHDKVDGKFKQQLHRFFSCVYCSKTIALTKREAIKIIKGEAEMNK